ncbi:MAG: class I SAM-dependent methyltransferase [Candidatus Pacebacteria bacterium]|nr:class I SAM-dependent methyltransferase [Candidatus Paceibacterota bacterium]
MSFLDLIPHKRFILSNILLFNKRFTFNKQKLSYFLNPYNASFANERAVEVSIIKNEIDKAKTLNKDILEIGNVLSHYLTINHTVVDKYEKDDEVINEDALTYNPSKKFDLIVAISTFEHIGYDEKIKDPQKIIKVINHLKTLLKRKGKLIFTVPISYNKILNKQILKNELPINKSIYLIRNSKINTWEETKLVKALKQKYNTPYPNANAIMIGFVNKD